MNVPKRWTLFDYIIFFLMLMAGLILLYPMMYIFSISLSDSCYVAQNKVIFFPKGFSLDAYKMIFENGRIPRAYLNTIIYTASGTAVNLFMTAVSAYPLSKKNFFGRRFFITAIVITMFFSGGMIPTYIIVQRLGLIDTIWALILPNAIWTFELLVLKSFYESMDSSIFESAVIDGASEYRILFCITLPLSKAAIASIGLLYFMGHWNSFFLPLIYLNDNRKMPLQVILQEMLINDTVKESDLSRQTGMTVEGMKNATIIVSLLPVLIIYTFAQKYFVKEVILGSVKG